MTLDGTAPTALHEALRVRFSAYAGPRDAFNPTDVVQPGMGNCRLAFLWRSGPRWLAAMEVGGRGYSIAVAVFELDTGGHVAQLVEEVTAYPDTLCRTATRLIRQVPQ